MDHTIYLVRRKHWLVRSKETITGDGYEYEYRHSFKGDKEYFGKIAQGTLEAGDYTISLIPHGKKGASAKFVLNMEE